MQALIQFIESHDGCRVECVVTGRLEVSSLMVAADGKVFQVSEQMDATMRAARDWLGY